MKANLKGGNAIVRLLLGHGEKIGMLGIVVCTGMLIWSAIGVAELEDSQTPSDLNRISNQALQKIDNSSWRAEDVGNEIVIVSKPMADGEAAMIKISSDHYPRMNPMNPRILKQIALRTDPLLLSPEDLEANGDFGLWASADPETIEAKRLEEMRAELQRQRDEEERLSSAEDEDPRNPRGRGEGFARPEGARGREEEGRRRSRGPVIAHPRLGVQLDGYEDITARSWVTVLARVPVKQQYQMYEDALEEARGYNSTSDIPLYLGYIVERAEVTDSGLGDWIEIAQVGEESLSKELETYPHRPGDVIDPRVDHPLLTHPLPPLVLREWDARVSHSSMPLADEIDPYEDLETSEDGDGPEAEEGKRSPFSRRESTRRGPGVRSEFGEARREGRSTRPVRRPERVSSYGLESLEGERGGEGRGVGRRGAGRPGQAGGIVLGTFVWDQATSHVLLRFFDQDSSLKPGHRYRYRVRLVLEDVNEGVREKYLDNSVTDRLANSSDALRMTEWSKPSNIATVPLAAQVHLVQHKPAKESSYNDESEVELLVKALNSQFASEIAILQKFVLGSVVNLYDSPEVMWTSRKEEEMELPDKFHFRTGITLLDVAGGEKINRDYVSLSRALMMDPGGKLFILSELDDQEEAQEFEDAKDSGDDDRRRGFPGSGREGGGEGGYFGER